MNQADSGMLELISAQNRTTHAVRALVKFVLIQVSAVCAAALAVVTNAMYASTVTACDMYGNCGSNSSPDLGIAVAALGFVWALIAAWKELNQSGVGLV